MCRIISFYSFSVDSERQTTWIRLLSRINEEYSIKINSYWKWKTIFEKPTKHKYKSKYLKLNFATLRILWAMDMDDPWVVCIIDSISLLINTNLKGKTFEIFLLSKLTIFILRFAPSRRYVMKIFYPLK